MANISYLKQTFDKEREFYNTSYLSFKDCVFNGPVDGESPLKESNNIDVDSCTFGLRYAFWHNNNSRIINSHFLVSGRAPFWYCSDIHVDQTEILAPKAFRESKFLTIHNCVFSSEEIFWKCDDIYIYRTSISGEYPFFMSKNIKAESITLNGKYSFQYCEGGDIANSKLDTKDAFWHSKNLIIRDSEIDGEYVGWYSENLTFINCKIKGTQPFCYCKSLHLVNCELIDADLAFEYSEVYGRITSEVISIKNPLKGRIVVKSVKEIIKENSKHNSECDIVLIKEEFKY